MKSLNDVEMVNINGGSVDKKKERSGFDGFLDIVGGAIVGFSGVISSWFS